MAVWSMPGTQEILVAERWDAEYFQPRFRELEAHLNRSCEFCVSDLASLSLLRFDSTKIKQFEYVEISSVGLDVGNANPAKTLSSETPDRAQFLLDGGEILVSTVRPNRSCVGLVGQEAKGWVASSGFAVLKAKTERLRSFLFVWLKTKTATDWLDRCATASMYPAVSVPDILIGQRHFSDGI